MHFTISVFGSSPAKPTPWSDASGAGKSTILSLLLRLYDPTAGVVRIDGHDLRTLTQKSLREQIGLVTQETFLFHDTIFKNIQFGRLDATPEEIYAAAQTAFAHDFIIAQPDGYETVIGDKGCLLSGGQQQRLAIARALLKNAPILLARRSDVRARFRIGETNSDARSNGSRPGRTVIAIAHRLSTILSADQIVVMDHGRIIETGTHAELLEKSGHYRRLYDLQFNRSTGRAVGNNARTRRPRRGTGVAASAFVGRVCGRLITSNCSRSGATEVLRVWRIRSRTVGRSFMLRVG